MSAGFESGPFAVAVWLLAMILTAWFLFWLTEK